MATGIKYFLLLRPNVLHLLYENYLAKEANIYWVELGLCTGYSSEKEILLARREVTKYNIKHGYTKCMYKDLSFKPFSSCYSDCLSIAARYGNILSMQWLWRYGFVWDESIIAIAARYGHTEMVKWLYNSGCPCDGYTCSILAQHGYLEILQWLRSNGCNWNPTICEYAARGGHLHILSWLISQNAPLYERVATVAAEAGKVEALILLISKGCPRSDINIMSILSKQGLLTERVLLWFYAP